MTASFAGLVRATASFPDGYGGRLEYPENFPSPQPRPPSPIPPANAFAPPTVVATTDPTIAAALDRVFSENPREPIEDVKAVVVVKHDHVMAERYAPGFGIDTPLLSYLVAKSFANAFVGHTGGAGRLRVDQPVAAPEWAEIAGPCGQIAIEHLLQKRSGLDAAETGTGFDPASQMLFAQSDMASFAARDRLKYPPGSHWEYTSANIGNIVGGGAAGMRVFAEKELLTPRNMSNVTMEFDGKGVFVGLYTAARAFARFGELYTKDGAAPNGCRILPEGWVAWSRRSVLGAEYGAGFRTNDGPNEYAPWRVENGFPKDGFFARGTLGQVIYIVPSERTAVARFGCSWNDPSGMLDEDDRALIAAVIRATHDQLR